MDLKKLVEAIDAQVLSGDIAGAFDAFAADNCITHSTPDDITHSKGQKSEALHWFFSNVDSVNKIERPAFTVVGKNETHSQFLFDFTNKQGQSLVYNEVIRRVWADGKLVEEQYLFGQTIAPETKTKKAKADATAAPAAAPVAKAKKETAPKATAKKEEAPKAATKKEEVKTTAKAKPAAAPKADDLTIIEGIGPKIAELLVAAGIVSFADLAKAKPAAIKTILDAAGKKFQMHDPATWPKQAALARDGKSAELTKLQEKLKGGK